ncbi:MAG: RnfABCDGE type electron transport complex subunit D, partial [Bacteroidales bacterium]|nr:RnfABCDGE type electron transport complex subunit D [Bacteroidales bacterium]
MKSLEKFIYTKKEQLAASNKRKWLPVFESFETFLFVPAKATFKGSHVRDAIDLKRAMFIVILALLPAMLFGVWNVGSMHFMAVGETHSFWQTFSFGFCKFLPLLIVSYGVGLGIEFIFVYLRGHEINEGYLVSGFLIPLIVPIDIPLWQLALAVA